MFGHEMAMNQGLAMRCAQRSLLLLHSIVMSAISLSDSSKEDTRLHLRHHHYKYL